MKVSSDVWYFNICLKQILYTAKQENTVSVIMTDGYNRNKKV